MRPLIQALHDHDLILLRVIGEWWDLELTGADKPACIEAVAEALAQLDLPQELSYLPPEEAAGVTALAALGGRQPVAAYEREHGEVRLMGPGRLEREEPWFDPVSPAEALWYRGLLFRGFDETAEGVIEFFFLPNEFLTHFPESAVAAEPPGEPGVTPASVAVALAAAPPPGPAPLGPVDPVLLETVAGQQISSLTDCIDDVTTLLLLGQRTGLQPGQFAWLSQFLVNRDPERWSLLSNLAVEMGLLTLQAGVVRPLSAAVPWLKQSREAQLRALADAWSCSSWNELCHTPGLRCEGEQWQNDPILGRTALLDACPRTPQWYRLDDLLAAIEAGNPDFQRPDGNYDTWYVRDEAKDVYLNGFESWSLVEGRLLRFLIEGPMSWLGLAVTAVHENERFYRLTDRALEWLAGTAVQNKEVTAPLVVEPDATVVVPHDADRFHRFQVGRVSEPLPLAADQPYHYRITPNSLTQAQSQGISAERILQFLTEASGPPLPASAQRGIKRWAEKGMEGRLETVVILRVRDAAILETLRQNPKTRDFLGESFGDLAVAVIPENWEVLRAAIAKLGLLLDINDM